MKTQITQNKSKHARSKHLTTKMLGVGLSSALLLSCITPSTNASTSKTFADQNQITNTLAVDIITSLGIMIGDENNNFNPQEPVTRAEMAVICTTMLNGANFPYQNFEITHIFDDVPDWATGYVNIAAAQNIIRGYGDGTFGPDVPVTSIDALLMIMKTLGYFQNQSEFGSNWTNAVLAKAGSLGFFHENQNASDNAYDPLTREDVAIFVFHAMSELAEVDYNEAFGAYYNRGKSMVHGVDNSIYEDTLGYKFKTWS